MSCLKCGGTGTKLDNTPCDCGAYVEPEVELSPQEIYIPEFYRNIPDDLGVDNFIVGELDNRKTFSTFLDKLASSVSSIVGHPSLFIDLSNTELGAYEVYYSLVKRIIKETGDFKDTIKDMFRVNEMDLDRFRKSEEQLRSGVSINHAFNYIISDFSVDKYEDLNKFVKLFEPKDAIIEGRYPLTMYVLKIKYGGVR